MSKDTPMRSWWQRTSGLFILLIVLTHTIPVFAVDSICALVKIEIEQTLTLERQAFDARMAIINHLDTVALEDVKVDVVFTDAEGNSVPASSDPNDTAATFFIRVDSLANIADVAGTGTVAPGSEAEVHWLIIPAPGAGGTLASGKPYDVGAVLRYTQNGEPQEIAVAPDLIFVKPLPQLALDYFLTRDVVADDPFTDPIEPPEPFTLGVRVANNGGGPATNLAIDTAQPKIVENELGLLIDFRITGAQIDNEPVDPVLLLDFGDIEAGLARVGRWQMETNLSGTFVEFAATFSHADELGGRLTSLIDTIDTHLLIQNVRVDLPGRDPVRDFLATDGDILRVYESDYLDSIVSDLTADAVLTAMSDNRYRLTVPETLGMTYVELPDPYAGTKYLSAAYRGDGTQLPQENAWLSKTAIIGGGWDHRLHVFDHTPSAHYILAFGSDLSGNQAPVLQHITDKTFAVETPGGFLIEVSDPNRTIPQVTAAPLPTGASLVADILGYDYSRYVFEWTPQVGQNGTYRVVFTASDGALETTRTVLIRVTSPEDSDGDGMPDAWEMAHFGSLDQDAFSDFDGDGILDVDEYRNGTDPTTVAVPHAPAILQPPDGSRVLVLQPELVVQNGDHAPQLAVTYTFEVYADAALTELVERAQVPQQIDTTAHSLTVALADNHGYYWRVNACDDQHCSDWVYAGFFTDTVNEAPQPFHLGLPEDGSRIATLQPLLQVDNSVDPDGDPIFYRFELFAEDTPDDPIAVSDELVGGDTGTTTWQVSPPLTDGGLYRWRVWATDALGLSTASSETFGFLVDLINDPPPAPAIGYPSDGEEIALQSFDVRIVNVADPEGDPLDYEIQLDTVNTFDSPDKRTWSVPANEASGETPQHIDGLTENTRYHLRVNASDGHGRSDWTSLSFFINTSNDPPSTPVAENPADRAWIETRRPTLSLIPATDPDEDLLRYEYQIARSAQDFSAALTLQTDQAEATPGEDLPDNTWHYWRIRALDEHGLASPWSAATSFFVNDNGLNDPPSLTLVQPAAALEQSLGTVRIEWVDADPDSNAQIDLFYSLGSPDAAPVPIIQSLAEDPDGEGDVYTWDISSLAPGDYYLSALITDDGGSQAESRAAGMVRVTDERRGTLTIISDEPAQTDESGRVHRFSVVLDVQPDKKVIVPLASSDETEGILSKSRLKFTRKNWDKPQEVRVIGVDDCLADGDVDYAIVPGPLASKDPLYDGVEPTDRLHLSNRDDDARSDDANIAVCDYVLKRKIKKKNGIRRYIYRLRLSNLSDARLTNVRGVIRSDNPEVTVIDGNLKVNKIGAGKTVRSKDTFSIEHHRRYSFDPRDFVWEFTYRQR